MINILNFMLNIIKNEDTLLVDLHVLKYYLGYQWPRVNYVEFTELNHKGQGVHVIYQISDPNLVKI